MKPTTVKWLLAVSLSLNLGMLATVLVRQMQAPSPVNLPTFLQLDEGQRQRWQQIEAPFLQDLAGNWREIRRHREALIRQIFSAAPQRAAIDAEQAGIAALQDAQQRRVITQLLAERELLSETQRARLINLLLSRYQQDVGEEELLHRE